ncbi:hypothetical protein BZA05DRAFT_169161 [Tricharina praecox]|uniref:uncharacterized protein n=1 Tax=Tricharina praecox TaxID=43433 RepID=UPI00221EF41C|nr:uncharacterized protein BZA05DRAFT_169161 [Tricharina praecox]KAI5857233.1 hypothetical protein BZA05DRAFT_169161 [Tricharina praecox]
MELSTNFPLHIGEWCASDTVQPLIGVLDVKWKGEESFLDEMDLSDSMATTVAWGVGGRSYIRNSCPDGRMASGRKVRVFPSTAKDLRDIGSKEGNRHRFARLRRELISEWASACRNAVQCTLHWVFLLAGSPRREMARCYSTATGRLHSCRAEWMLPWARPVGGPIYENTCARLTNGSPEIVETGKATPSVEQQTTPESTLLAMRCQTSRQPASQPASQLVCRGYNYCLLVWPR